MNQSTTNFLPAPQEFSQLQYIANTAMQSQLYAGVGSEQKIFMILLAARELGIPPMQALNGGIYNIKGKIELSPRLMSSMIRRAGHSIDIKVLDDNECILVGKRGDNGDTHTAKFTIDDAKLAGLMRNDVWKSYAEDMLYARAMSRLGRRLFADVIGTSYVQGEIAEAKPEKKESKIEMLPTEFEEVTQVETITVEQYEPLQALFDMCDVTYIKKMNDWLASKKVMTLDKLPITLYAGMKKSIDAHLAEKYGDRAIGES